MLIDSAAVLNELVHAAEQGKRKLTPKTRARILNPYGAVGLNNVPGASRAPRNRAEAMRAHKLDQERRESELRREKLNERSIKIKKDIALHRQQKQE